MSAWGAFIGLLVSIFLIIRKISPVYSLILGALVGGLLGIFYRNCLKVEDMIFHWWYVILKKQEMGKEIRGVL